MESLVDEVSRSARAVFQREIPRDSTLARINGQVLPRHLWRAGAGVGWPRLLTSTDRGGLGAGPAEAVALFREAGHSLPNGPLFETVVAGGLLRTHVDLGPDDLVITLGLSGNLAHHTSSTSTVELVDGVLRGTLVLVDHADASDRLIVVARVEGMRALAVVDMNSPRVKVARMDSFDPVIRPCQVTLASAEPISSPVTGQVARMLIEDISIYGLLTTTAQLSGIMDEVLRMSVQYAKDRIQFGRPIGAFQSIQHRLADMAVLCAAGESSCDAAVAIASAGRSDKAVGLGGLKGAVSSYARAVVESGLQVHGGIGFTDEHVLHLYFKHALRMQAAWGSDADHAIAVARRILAAT